MKPIKQFQNDILGLPEGKTERSYYSPFEVFLKAQLGNVETTAEETAEGKIGFPDITVRHATANKEKIGWIEVKTPDETLSDGKFNVQFNKYKEGLENIIFTNFRQWELWQWKDNESHKVMEIVCDITDYTSNSEKQLYKLLERFKECSVTEVATSEQLALALARKAKLLSEQVAETLDEEDEKAPLTNLKKAFEKTLISNINARQFANMVAETLTYSLFLAALESEAQGDKLTLQNAVNFLPKNVPVLRDLYDIVLKTSKKISGIKQVAELIIDQLKVANLFAVMEEISRRKPGEDAIIHFYEPFLNAYSPEERKNRGVYYTPKAVVDFIVRSTDFLLQKHFDKKDGLADEQVQILDPSVGTGTFLLSAIETVQQKTMDKYAKTNLHKEKFRNIVSKHILKNFYGFELMIAPYAIAHLKLALELKRMGYDIADDSRLQIYLANTLDDPNAPPKIFVGFEALSEEGAAANEIKKERPILAIIGNPPYANYGKMNKQKWILDLLDDYKKNLDEKKINLDDDYIKFIRFAQWKITATGKGIFAMITANSFIDGITQRRMRESLLNTFDEMYIYNLHGNSRKGEIAPGGGKDENVFDIQTGVSINIFVKKERKSGDCKVFYADAWGRRKDKFQMLEQNFDDVDWQEVDYRGFNNAFLSTKWGDRLGKLNFFVPAKGETTKMAEYGKFWGMQDIFQENVSGIQSSRDHLAIQFEDGALQSIMNDFANKDIGIEAIRTKYKLGADGDGWNIRRAREDLNKNKKQIVDILYRPFDIRKTIFTGKVGFLNRPRTQVMQHMLSPNLALISERTIPYQADISVTCSKDMVDLHLIGGVSYTFPLYIYPENQLTTDRISNLSSEFMKALAANLSETPSPEEVFYYAYAIFHCPKYRQRYTEFLKIDFPRLPLTNDKKLFDKLSRLGNDLVNLHLLGENLLNKNSLDNSKTIFDTPNKWKISIGGKAASAGIWQVDKISHDAVNNRVYINKNKDRYFEGIDKATWQFAVGDHQPLDKWLKDRKKSNRPLSANDKEHYMKIAVSLRKTQKIMQEIDALIPNWNKFCK